MSNPSPRINDTKILSISTSIEFQKFLTKSTHISINMTGAKILKRKKARSQSNQTRSYLNFQVQISESVLKKAKCRFARRCQWTVPPYWHLQHSMLKLCSANDTVLFSHLNWDCIQTWYHNITGWKGPQVILSDLLPKTEAILNSDQTAELGPEKPHGQRSTSALGNLFPSSTASPPSSHAENFSVQIYS